MSYIKRMGALVLCASISAGILMSCGESDKQQPPADYTEEAQVTADIGEEVETNPYGKPVIKDLLPDDLDFGGLEIRILHRDDGGDLNLEIYAEDETGDIVDTAVYRRNQKLEERLNIKIRDYKVASTIHEGAPVNEVIRKTVASGSDEYDLAANHMSQGMPLALEGMYRNLMGLPYLDFDKPWWVADFMENITVYGKCYAMAGDIGLTMIQSEYLMFYNKTLHEALFSENIYDIVYGGSWTLDKLSSMAEVVYSDLNGDGTADYGDQYGYCTTPIRFVDALLSGANIHITDMDENGEPYFSVEQNPKTYEFVEKVHSLFYDNNRSLVYGDPKVDDQVEDAEVLNTFKNGRIYIVPNTIMGAAGLRDMEDDFGVIPVVKLNEEQPEYVTALHNGFSAWFIPITSSRADEAAAFSEAMCSESYNNVTEAYYEIALKEKYSRDEETQKMLDFIRSSIRFNFGWVNTGSLDNVYQQFRDLVRLNSDKVASSITKKMTACQKKLDKFLEIYSELD